MITASELEKARDQANEYLLRAGIVLTSEEQATIEAADFGLSELKSTGLELVVYLNTERCCAKELVLFPRQTCPQHRHPPVGDDPGKEETFRCRWGELYLYVEGAPTPNPRAIPPSGRESSYTVWHEVVLKPGEQYTLMPGILHWFQSGPDGAVVSEFSTTSRDEYDYFQDPEIRRATEVRSSE